MALLLFRKLIRCAGFFALTAAAATVPRFSLEDLVSRSEIIAQAQVVNSWPAWDAQHKYIWTHYQMRVTDSIRGGEQTLVVSEPGGSLDGVSQAFSGMNAWTPGENVVLFLHHVPNGYLRVTGGEQGDARIGSDGRVRLSAAGVVRSTSAGTDLRHLSGMSLDSFKARVRSTAAMHPAMKVTQ
ncbi:MAG TPA: hypothetical protein VFA04_01790 [Bryobacteraceae bacterium]|nr:hypothetical protein [Bryobacteraceae bacterium]